MFSIYTKANVLKYLPGNVMEFVGRNVLLHKYGLRHRDIALASLIETLLNIAVVFLCCIFIAFEQLRSFFAAMASPWRKPPLLFAALVVLAILFFVLKKADRRYELNLKRYLSKPFFLLLAKTSFTYVLIFLSFGLTFLLLFPLVLNQTLSPQESAAILGAFLISWIAGYITPGAPGGLGVREAALVLMLAGTMGEEVILLAAFLYRLISIVGDLIAYFFGLYAGRPYAD